MKPVEIFHIGPPKTATTWFYFNLREHPQVVTSPRDTIHYFDMFYAKGRDWYESHFAEAGPDQKLFDPTPSYLPCPRAGKRVFEENPGAKIIFTLRHPIERAFSHYWHIKKTGPYFFEFEDVFKVYDCFEDWLAMGFYGSHLEPWLELFGREQFHPVPYEDISAKPRETYKSILEFCDLDTSHEPAGLGQKMNAAGPRMTLPRRAVNKMGRIMGVEDHPLILSLSGRKVYKQGIAVDTYNRLLELALPEIEKTETLLGVDLSHWKHEKREAA